MEKTRDNSYPSCNEVCMSRPTSRKRAGVTKKYINYNRDEIYAIYYREVHTIYYNLDFKGEVRLIVYG